MKDIQASGRRNLQPANMNKAELPRYEVSAGLIWKTEWKRVDSHSETSCGVIGATVVEAVRWCLEKSTKTSKHHCCYWYHCPHPWRRYSITHCSETTLVLHLLYNKQEQQKEWWRSHVFCAFSPCLDVCGEKAAFGLETGKEGRKEQIPSLWAPCDLNRRSTAPPSFALGSKRSLSKFPADWECSAGILCSDRIWIRGPDSLKQASVCAFCCQVSHIRHSTAQFLFEKKLLKIGTDFSSRLTFTDIKTAKKRLDAAPSASLSCSKASEQLWV